MTVCCGRGIWASGTWNCSILCLWRDVCTHMFMCVHTCSCVCTHGRVCIRVHVCALASVGLWVSVDTLNCFPPCFCFVVWNRIFHSQPMLFFLGESSLYQVDKKTLTGHLLSLKLPDWTGVTYVHPVCLFVWFLNVNAEEILVWGALHCLKHLPSPASSLLKGVWRCLLWGRKCLVSQSYDNQSSTPPTPVL